MTKHEQQMAALQLANKVRISNGNLLREIGELAPEDGLERVAELLVDLTPTVGGMPIGRLLTSPRGLGFSKAATLLRAVQVRSLDRKVRDLSDRQRQELARLITNRGWLSREVQLREWAEEMRRNGRFVVTP